MPEGGARSGSGATPVAVAERRAREALAGTRFADVRWAATTGSTNADALALARAGGREGIVVVADHQSAGRGRRDRRWVAPPGGSLLVSVLLRPPARVAGAVTMAAGVALAAAVEELAGVTVGLKWPNDLVVAGVWEGEGHGRRAGSERRAGERKLAGILAEADWSAGSTASGGYRAPGPHERTVVVVGVGLNVTWPRPASLAADDPLAEVAGVATALNWEGADVDRVDVLVAFLGGLDARYAELVRSGPSGLLDEWRRRSATLGRRVRVDLGADDVEGTAVDVTGDGHLVVETLEGVRRTLAVGDVVHVRAV